MQLWTITWPNGAQCRFARVDAGFTPDYVKSIKACDRLWGQSVMVVQDTDAGPLTVYPCHADRGDFINQKQESPHHE